MANYDKIMSQTRLVKRVPRDSPSAGNDTVVIYTTLLRGVPRTSKHSNKVQGIHEVQRVVFDELDVSLHGEFFNKLRELLGYEAIVPRVFVKGRYLGGAEEVIELNETGKLRKILSMRRLACEDCSGTKFVSCVECEGVSVRPAKPEESSDLRKI
ncbi:uncharacterized protein At3g28850-like [Hibiscus syriacus]|uniref:uncharacterized protein At3g28850-like n=1 Tax=Hibiscus syriacus TaxID=106335 RepID=UPI0019207402|nr:uncharacterized protein At3g28850-like [Hibiscus syriacus]